MTFIIDKMREVRLRWLKRVKRRCTIALVIKCEKLTIVGIRRGKEKMKKVSGR